MKYEVKGLFSYGVYDGDRLLTTYESEKTAQCVADALNDEAARVVPSFIVPADQEVVNAAEVHVERVLDTSPNHTTESWTLNGQDKETT